MWYILRRDADYQLIYVVGDNDPLYGYGSWDLYDGPFAEFEEADRVLRMIQ